LAAPMQQIKSSITHHAGPRSLEDHCMNEMYLQGFNLSFDTRSRLKQAATRLMLKERLLAMTEQACNVCHAMTFIVIYFKTKYS
jgi:hypothetical protein